MATDEPESVHVKKKLVVLCDGTWQNSDRGYVKDHWYSPLKPQIPSNVTRIARAIRHEDKFQRPQVVYYHAGVGTSWSLSDKLLGGGLALGIGEQMREAYGFVAHNYAESATGEKDDIFLIGFSRGAFTARSVGGMIATLGLLKKPAMSHFYLIFDDFENAGIAGYQPTIKTMYPDFTVNHDAADVKGYLADYRAELIRLKLTRIVTIEAIAVWDTVGSLGLPVQPWLQKLGFASTIHKYRFFDTGISDQVKHAFHALALDENRSAFNATVWEKLESNTVTDLRQVWFAGSHSNIGGSYDDSCSADLTLAWMVDQLLPFLEFDEEYVIDQFRTNLKKYYYREGQPKEVGKRLWTWGTQTINDALTFPTNLAGSIVRSPGRYYELVYATGKPNPSDPKLLRDTHEHIHSSVRARFELHGKDASLTRAYNAPALRNWKLIKADEDQKLVESHGGRPIWRYQNPDDSNDLANNHILPEAPLGAFEALLLDLDLQTKTYLFAGGDDDGLAVPEASGV